MNMDLIDSALNRLDLKNKTQDAAIANEVNRAVNAENLKANIESPVFTGTPKAPTAPANTNNTQIATTAFVKTVVNALVNGAPETLDTLKELADAISENKDISDALNAAIGTKVNKSGDVMTGDLGVPIERATRSSTVPCAAALGDMDNSVALTDIANFKTILGSICINKKWHDILSIRHRNGVKDGSRYGMYIKSALTETGDLSWGKQYDETSWQPERVLLDDTNFTNYAFPKIYIVDKADTDLNDYSIPRICYFDSAYTPKNIPTGVNGWLIVLPGYGNAIKQIWYRHGTVNKNDYDMYTRTRDGRGIWSNWSRILTEHDIANRELIGSFDTFNDLWLKVDELFHKNPTETIIARFKDTTGWSPTKTGAWWRAIISAQNVMGRIDYGVDGSIIMYNSQHIFFGSVTGGEVDISNLTVTWRTIDTSTILTGTLAANKTSISFTDKAITDTATIDIYTDVSGVSPTNITINGNKITLTFAARSTATNVKIKIS